MIPGRWRDPVDKDPTYYEIPYRTRVGPVGERMDPPGGQMPNRPVATVAP